MGDIVTAASRARMAVWLIRRVAPLRWLVSWVVVHRAGRALSSRVCTTAGLSRRSCRRVRRRVGKTRSAKWVRVRLRRTVATILKA